MYRNMIMETTLPTYVFTSQIPTIVFAHAGTEPLTVRLLDGQDTFFETTLYPVTGKISFYDVGILYEEYLRSFEDNTMHPYIMLQLQVGDQVWEDNVIIYCPFNSPMQGLDFIATHFLTTISAKRIPEDCPSGNEWLDVIYEEEEDKTIVVNATFRNPEGVTETHTCSFTDDTEGIFSHIECHPAALLAMFGRHCDDEMVYDWRDLSPLSYSFSIGTRKLTYYVDDGFKPSVSFRFLNAFNVEETIYIEGETVTKTETERSIATSHRVSLFYDQVDSQEYEVTTAPLSSEEAAWATQMLLSHRVRRIEENGTFIDVLITKISSEVTDSDQEFRRLKFTYRLAKQGASLKISKNIMVNRRFTETYSLHFA